MSQPSHWYHVTIGDHRYYCDSDNSTFWSKVNDRTWEPETFRILDQLVRPDSVYCDIGAWIGPTVLYAARQCRQVYCFEPDRKAFMYLLHNIELNNLENVIPFNWGLADKNGLRWMASPRGKRGDSMTSLLYPYGKNKAQILCLNWQTWLDYVGSPRIDCIKMDVEGAEFELLTHMADYLRYHKPHLYLSLHPHLLEDSQRAEKMYEMSFLFDIYTRCYDQQGSLINVKTFSDKNTFSKGTSYYWVE